MLHWLAVRSNNTECWRVSPAEAVSQVAAWCDRETAIACLDTARTTLGFGDHEIALALAGAAASTRQLMTHSKSGSDSGPESVVRQRLLTLGIDVVQQVKFEGIGRVDMQIPGTNILIEIDGRQYHSDAAAFENDRRRRNELVRRGYIVLEFSFKQVFENWQWCESVVRGALSQFRSL